MKRRWQLLVAIAATVVGELGVRALLAAEPQEVGEHLRLEFEAGLKQNGVHEKFAGHCRFAAKLFEDSRGSKSFSDKTGNCRLRWVEKLVTDPAAAVGEAERFTSELMTAARANDRLASLLAIAAVKLDVEDFQSPPSTPSAAAPLEQVAAIAGNAKQAVERLLAPLGAEEQAELRQLLYAQSTNESKLGHRFADAKAGRRATDLVEKLDRRQFFVAASALAAATDAELLKSLATIEAKDVPAVKGIEGKLQQRVETPHGTIIVGNAAANTYRLDDLTDVCAVIDLGGNDVYIDGTTSASRPVLIVIDLAGDDTYRGKQPGIQGSAILGAALLIDAAGNDSYSAVDLAQGSALAGVGMLIDRQGDDRYRGDRRVQGQAVGGLGILIDRQGNDDYRGALLAQGVGGPLGLGLLADLEGTDHYFAGGKYPGGYDDTPGFGGWSQGVGVGPRGVANGGLGVLLDGGGDDVYEADYFSHGGGYWFAAGFARDFGGNDSRVGATRENFDGTPRTEPRFVRWGTGYGCHYAAGFVFDDAGDDTYEADFAVIAYAWDIALGVICDLAGDDRYLSAGSGVSQAHNAAVSLLYDRAGNDEYRGGLGATTEETPYHAQGGSGNFTLLFDEAGEDRYTPELPNAKDQTRGWAGARLLDR